MRSAPFRPSQHGFAFANNFEVPSSPFGFGAPVASPFGLCAGMAWAALDRYLAGRTVPAATQPPGAGDPLYAELLRRHANALGSADLAKLMRWQQLPESGWPGAAGLRERSRREWQALRRRLDSGEPALLALILAAGPYANPTTNHMVLAYGYDLDRRAGRVALRVYDPNRPGNDGVRLVFRLGGRGTPLEGRLAVETRVRGFYVVRYDRPRPAELSVASIGRDRGTPWSFDAAAPPALIAPDWGLRLFGRTGNGQPLYAAQGPDGRWLAELVEPRRAGSSVRLRGIPTPLNTGTRCLAVAADGELLECVRRPVFGWRVRPVARRESTGRLRVDDAAIAVADGPRRRARFYVVAGGRLVVGRRTLGGWALERPGGPALAGVPVSRPGPRGRQHVFVRSADGELIHFRRRPREPWTVEHVTTALGGRDRCGIAGDPVCVRADTGALIVVARNAAGDVLLFRWSARRGWRGRNLSAELRGYGEPVPPLASSPAAILDRMGTVHIAARGEDGGLLHFWSARDGEAGVDEVVTTRAAIGDDYLIDGAPRIAAAAGGWLHVFARRSSDVLLFRWAPGADWTVESVGNPGRDSEAGSVAEPSWLNAGDCCHLVFAGPAGEMRHLRLGRQRGRTIGSFLRTASAMASDFAGALLALPVTAAAAVAAALRAVLGGVVDEVAGGLARLAAGSRAIGADVAHIGASVRGVGRAGAGAFSAMRSGTLGAVSAARTASADAVASVRFASAGAIDAARSASADAVASVRAASAGVVTAALSASVGAVASVRPAPAAATDATRSVSARAATASQAERDRRARVAPDVATPAIRGENGSAVAPHLPASAITAGDYGTDTQTGAQPTQCEPIRMRSAMILPAAPEIPAVREAVSEPAPARAARAPARREAKPEPAPARAERAPARREAKPEPAPARAERAPARHETKPEPAPARAKPGSVPAPTEPAPAWPQVDPAPALAAQGPGGAAPNAPPLQPSAASSAAPTVGPRVNPALEGLPLLDEDEPVVPRPKPAETQPPAAPAQPALSAVARRKRDLAAMKRLMSLAEEYSTRTTAGDSPTSL